MPKNNLPEATQALWQQLQDSAMLNGFVLIGGTALAMQIDHRVSEDLDFAYLGESLPKQRIARLEKDLAGSGWDLHKSHDLAAIDDFIDAGLDLDEHQQNFLASSSCGEAKVSFVAFGHPVTDLLSGDNNAPLRIATLPEIFKTKAIAVSQRVKSRDIVDLYVLMNEHGFSIDDFHEVFSTHLSDAAFDIACHNLMAADLSPADEGYESLMKDPPSIEQMQSFFQDTINEYRRAIGHESIFEPKKI